MKQIFLFLSIFLFAVSDLKSQTPFKNLGEVQQYIIDSITKRPDKITANTLNKAYNGVLEFIPVVGDTSAVVAPKHGYLRFQRSDSTAYVYDTIGTKRWRPIAKNSGLAADVFLQNNKLSGFDSVFYFPGYDANLIKGRAIKVSNLDNSVDVIKPAATNTDSTTEWQISVPQANITSFDNVAQLRASTIYTKASQAYTKGYYAAGDGGGTSFYWDATSGLADDGIYVLKPTAITGNGRWLKVFNGVVRASEAGVKTDGTNQAALLSSIASNATVKEILFDNGSTTILGNADFQNKKIVFKNGAKIIIGANDTLKNALIECDPLKQCFDVSAAGSMVNGMLNSWKSIVWFGAISDLLPDKSNIAIATRNKNAIVKALASGKPMFATATYMSQSSVYFPASPNYYYVEDSFQVRSRIYLIGDGSGLTKLQFPSNLGYSAIDLHYTNGSNIMGDNIHIKGMTIEGGDATHYATGLDFVSNGIRINTPFNVFEDVEVFGFRGCGWKIEGCGGNSPRDIADYNTLKDCKGNFNGTGIYFNGCDAQGNIIQGGQFSYNASVGIRDNSLGNNFDGVGNETNAIENVNQKSMVGTGMDSVWRALSDNNNSYPTISNPNWQFIGRTGYGTFVKLWNSTTQYYVGNIGYFIENASAKSTLKGDYSEGDQRGVYNLGQATGIGGFAAGNGVEPGMIGMYQGIINVANVQATDPVNNISTILWGSGHSTFGFNDPDNSQFFGFTYYKPNKSFGLSTNGSFGGLFMYSPLSSITGRAVPSGGILAETDALVHWNGTDAFNLLGVAKSTPTTGQHYLGDFYLNINISTINTIRGWICSTPGNPGTFTAITTIDPANVEQITNKSTATSLGTSNTLYPTQNAVKTYVDNAVVRSFTQMTDANIALTRTSANMIVMANAATSFTAARTITFPASPITNDRITIKNGGGGAFVVNLSPAPKINSITTTSSIAAGNWSTYVFDGTNWWEVETK